MSTTAPPARISVTAEHIANGIARNCLRCPIALAVAAATGSQPESIIAWQGDITLDLPGGETWIAATPEAAAEFIGAFDQDRGTCEPFEFELEWHPEAEDES